jgi:hypothetical protein
MNLTDKLLIKIKNMKRVPFKRKSLDALAGFIDGVMFRERLHEWEKTTGLSLSENFNNAIDSVMGSRGVKTRQIMDSIPLSTSDKDAVKIMHEALSNNDEKVIPEEEILRRKHHLFDEFVKSHYGINGENNA